MNSSATLAVLRIRVRAVCRRDKSQEDHETRVGKYIMEKEIDIDQEEIHLSLRYLENEFLIMLQ